MASIFGRDQKFTWLLVGGPIICAGLISFLVQFYDDYISLWNIHQTFNFFEGLLWLVVGIVILQLKSRKSVEPIRRIFIPFAISFFIFGVSDFIEMHTGAWYKPWWLFAMKAVCVTSFIYCFRIWWKFEKSNF
ncbi:MAG: hypothetical protein CL677_08620 [Bdellovibrionaceae bacterium]|nr:hypothetical protein [Pseudobdellovibrionaceae bacterium]|tara:strand:- start:1449 stop:1847 length:399 start_codon:yes stop_codon:yes gene_type:complete